MKPNGRRAWRKSCKFMRKSEGSAYPADVARRNRKRPGFCDDQRPSIAKPFTPLSLVGMTMAARKRRARKEAGDLGHMLYADFRIGQRLRPCPGCPSCVTQMQDWSVDGAWVEGQAVKHRDGCSHDDPTGYCCFGEIVQWSG